MSDYRIVEVKTKRDLRKFIRFPDELYKKCAQYVPALHSDQYNSLVKCSTAKYCPHKMWLAVDEKGRVAGRICAMVNPRYNDLYGKKRARFGWFDTVEDFKAAELLIGTAEKWAAEQGMDEIHGPLYYNTLGKQGMLVEGFENTPPFNCLYNYPYYNDYVERLGYEKECDWLQYKLPAQGGTTERIIKFAALLKERYKLHEGSIEKLKKDKEMVKKFFDMYNKSFATSVLNFIPFTDEEIEEEAASVMPFLSDKTSSVVLDENNELVAFGITFPSISEALKKAKGRLFPFGWFYLVKALKNYRVVDLMLNGAVPEWQNKGVSSIYHQSMAVKYKAMKTMWAISNPQIETNSAVNVWSHYDNELYMRRRCYLKKI